MIAAAQYTSAAENRAAADAIRKRLMAPGKPKVIALEVKTITADQVETHSSFSVDMDGDYKAYTPPTIIFSDTNDRLSLRQITLELLKRYPGITLDVIRGDRCGRPVSVPRQRIMYEIKKLQPWRSYSEIGRFFNKNHATVINAFIKMTAVLEGDDKCAAKYSLKRERDRQSALSRLAILKAKQMGVGE